MGIKETIVESILDEMGVTQEDIDKATTILDMLSFTKEDGQDVIIVQIGENVQIKLNR